jgi:hypothetical protein
MVRNSVVCLSPHRPRSVVRFRVRICDLCWTESPPHTTICPYRLRCPPPGCGRSLTDFWGWGAHRARLRCPDDVSDDTCERGISGEALNLSSTSYPDHGQCGDLPLHGKIPTAGDLPLQGKNSQGRIGNRTRDLMVSNQTLWPTSHEAGRVGQSCLRHIFFRGT